MEANVLIPISEYERLMELANISNKKVVEPVKQDKRYEYGIPGIQNIFNCSYVTASKIKASGKIDKAITQIGRKIIIDADLAMELAGQKNGGRTK